METQEEEQFVLNTWVTRVDFKKDWKDIARVQNKRLHVERESNGSRKCKIKCKDCSKFQIWGVQSRTSGIWKIVAEKTSLSHGNLVDGELVPCTGLWKSDPSKLKRGHVDSDDDDEEAPSASIPPASEALGVPVLAAIEATAAATFSSMASIPSHASILPKKRAYVEHASSSAAPASISVETATSSPISHDLVSIAAGQVDSAEPADESAAVDRNADKRPRFDCPKCGRNISRNTKHPEKACHNAYLRSEYRKKLEIARRSRLLSASTSNAAGSDSTEIILPSITLAESSVDGGVEEGTEQSTTVAPTAGTETPVVASTSKKGKGKKRAIAGDTVDSSSSGADATIEAATDGIIGTSAATSVTTKAKKSKKSAAVTIDSSSSGEIAAIEVTEEGSAPNETATATKGKRGRKRAAPVQATAETDNEVAAAASDSSSSAAVAAIDATEESTTEAAPIIVATATKSKKGRKKAAAPAAPAADAVVNDSSSSAAVAAIEATEESNSEVVPIIVATTTTKAKRTKKSDSDEVNLPVNASANVATKPKRGKKTAANSNDASSSNAAVDNGDNALSTTTSLIAQVDADPAANGYSWIPMNIVSLFKNKF